jgi:glutaredoxin
VSGGSPAPQAAAARPSARALLGLVALILVVMSVHGWWQGRQQASVGERVAAAAQPGDIRMLASETCPSCIVAHRWFAQHGVAYEACTIERDEACRAEFEARRGIGTPLFIVRGIPQLGFDPQRLAAALGA